MNKEIIGYKLKAGILDIWFTPVYKEEPKFEEGKWYRYTEGQGWALRCCTTSSDKLEFDSYIRFSPKEFYEGSTKSNYSIGSIYLTNIEVPLSEIQQYLPDGHPDKILKEFVLPETWWVRVTEENQDIVSNWRGDFRDFKIPIGGVAGMYDWGTRISKEHNIDATPRENWGTEITFEQFKKYVLKEVDWSKATKEEVLAEAKRRYKIGDKSHSLVCNSEFTITTLDKFIYQEYPDGDTYLYHNNGHNLIYKNGQWAEIIEQPKPAGIKVEHPKELFSKEQLEVINKMIDKKIKELE